MFCDCTGLPPGELIRSTTPCVFLSLKADCSEFATFSELESVPGPMIPLISTSAVCRPPFISPPPFQSIASAIRNVMYAKVSSFQKMPQRRARRCSLSASVASFSIKPRSHCPSLSAIVDSFEVNPAVPLLHLQRHERRAAAGSAEAFSAVRGVGRAVRRAYQIAALEIEDFSLAPVEFHRHVAAAVEVAVHAPREAHHERGRVFAEVLHLEAHRLAGVHQRLGSADHAFIISHRRSSPTLETQARGSQARNDSCGCAP